MFLKIIAIYCESHMKHIHTLSRKDVRVFLMLKYVEHIVKGITSNMFEMQVLQLTWLCMYCHVLGFP
jgi:hypothetical protein